jgi:hypothetical protein
MFVGNNQVELFYIEPGAGAALRCNLYNGRAIQFNDLLGVHALQICRFSGYF